MYFAYAFTFLLSVHSLTLSGILRILRMAYSRRLRILHYIYCMDRSLCLHFNWYPATAAADKMMAMRVSNTAEQYTDICVLLRRINNHKHFTRFRFIHRFCLMLDKQQKQQWNRLTNKLSSHRVAAETENNTDTHTHAHILQMLSNWCE